MSGESYIVVFTQREFITGDTYDEAVVVSVHPGVSSFISRSLIRWADRIAHNERECRKLEANVT